MESRFKPGDLVVRKIHRPLEAIAIFLGYPTGMGGQKRAFFLDAEGISLHFLDAYIHASHVTDDGRYPML